LLARPAPRFRPAAALAIKRFMRTSPGHHEDDPVAILVPARLHHDGSIEDDELCGLRSFGISSPNPLFDKWKKTIRSSARNSSTSAKTIGASCRRVFALSHSKAAEPQRSTILALMSSCAKASWPSRIAGYQIAARLANS